MAIRGLVDKSQWDLLDPVSVVVGSALKVNRQGHEFEAKNTVTAGEKLNKAKTDMAKAVEKWAFDNGLMVKRRKELWVRAANVIAFVLTVFGFFRRSAFRPPRGGCPSRRSSCSRGGPGTTVSARGERRPGANCGRRQEDFTACWPPILPRRGSTSRPARTSTPPTSRSRSPRAPRRCGPRSTRRRRAPLHRNRIGITRRPRRRPPAGVSRAAPEARTSTVSSRRCRRRSVPTPHRSRRRRPAAVQWQQQFRRRWRRRRRRRRRRIMVRLLLIVVLVLAVAVLVGLRVGYNKIRSADVRVAEALSGIDVELTRRASLIPSLVHTVQTFASPREGHPRPRHRRARRADRRRPAASRSPSAAPPRRTWTPRWCRCWRSARAIRS